MHPRDSEFPPVGMIEVGVKAYETQDTEFRIRTRAGIAEMLAQVRAWHTVKEEEVRDSQSEPVVRGGAGAGGGAGRGR